MHNIIKERTSEKYDGRLEEIKKYDMAWHYVADLFKIIDLKNTSGIDNNLQDYSQSALKMVKKPTIKLKTVNGRPKNILILEPSILSIVG